MTTKTLHSDPHKRLYSLDALRGFDMFWITGGGMLAVAISRITGAAWLETQMQHVSWEGFRFEDLIFPLFTFIAGAAIPFSILSKVEKNVPRFKLLKKAFYRMIILILLGILHNGTFKNGFTDGRIASVLGQIGIAYFIATLVSVYSGSLKWRIIWTISLLLGIAILQLAVPVPGFGAGNLTPQGCINGYIDRMYLPGKLYRDIYDPEGLLCVISAGGIALMGTFAGTILRSKKTGDWRKIGLLAAIGTGSVLVALAVSSFYPVIKSCWTTSFNLLAGGISFLLLALFYLLTDHWHFRKWAFYFRIIGMNSIFVYLFTRLVDVKRISESFLGWISSSLPEKAGQVVIVTGALAIIWLILYFMYRRNIFFRI